MANMLYDIFEVVSNIFRFLFFPLLILGAILLHKGVRRP